MSRPVRLLAFAIVASLLLLALSLYLHSWGGLTLIALGVAAFAWYRMQVVQGEEAQQFFGDLGEETRLTGFQAGAPSEMPVDRTLAGKPPPPEGQ